MGLGSPERDRGPTVRSSGHEGKESLVNWTSSIRRFQAAYYLGTGIWPLLHRSSFERVTGPKVDFWLAQMVGALTTVVGASLLGCQAVTPSREQRRLGAGSAFAFAAIDIAFGARGRISKIYLLDALLQVPLALSWCIEGRTAGEGGDDGSRCCRRSSSVLPRGRARSDTRTR